MLPLSRELGMRRKRQLQIEAFFHCAVGPAATDISCVTSTVAAICKLPQFSLYRITSVNHIAVYCLAEHSPNAVVIAFLWRTSDAPAIGLTEGLTHVRSGERC